MLSGIGLIIAVALMIYMIVKGIDMITASFITAVIIIVTSGLDFWDGLLNLPRDFRDQNDDENVVIATNQGEPLVGNDTPAGQAYANVVLRVQGKEVPFLNFEKGISFWTKVTGIFRKV